MKNIGVVGIGFDEALDKLAADFVARLADQGADRRDDAAALGAEIFHRLDGGFDDAGQRTFPSRMCGTDHARIRIDEEYWPAVGGGDADRKAVNAGDDRIGLRSQWAFPRAGRDDRVGRMDLMHVEKSVGCNAHRVGHPAAVLADIGGIVVRAKSAIEAGIDAVGDAAVAGEEGVAQAGNGGEQG